MCGFDDIGAYYANRDFFEKEHPKQAEQLQEKEFENFLRNEDFDNE